jgi:hypothetical protein
MFDDCITTFFLQNPRYLIHQALVLGGASVGCSRPDHFHEKYEKRRDENVDSEYMTNSSQVVGITSVLVATVTFAAAFTLPGGYRADDHTDAGTPTLASRSSSSMLWHSFAPC